MKITNIYLSGLFWTLLPFCSGAQNNPFWDVPTGKQTDSLKKVLAGSKNDTVNMYLNRQIGMHYQELDRPVALASYKNMLALAEKTDQRLWEAEALSRVGYVSCLMQDYSGGLRLFLRAKQIASETSAEKGMWKPGLLSKKSDPYVVRLTVMADIQQHLGLVHYFTGDFSKALAYHQQVKKINENLNDDALMATNYLNIGESYSALDQSDSAEFAFNRSLYFSDRSGFKKYKGLTLYDIGKIYQRRNN